MGGAATTCARGSGGGLLSAGSDDGEDGRLGLGPCLWGALGPLRW